MGWVKEMMTLAKTLALKSDGKEIPAIGITPCHCKTLVKNTPQRLKEIKIKKVKILCYTKSNSPKNGYCCRVLPLSLKSTLRSKTNL